MSIGAPSSIPLLQTILPSRARIVSSTANLGGTVFLPFSIISRKSVTQLTIRESVKRRSAINAAMTFSTRSTAIIRKSMTARTRSNTASRLLSTIRSPLTSSSFQRAVETFLRVARITPFIRKAIQQSRTRSMIRKQKKTIPTWIGESVTSSGIIIPVKLSSETRSKGLPMNVVRFTKRIRSVQPRKRNKPNKSKSSTFPKELVPPRRTSKRNLSRTETLLLQWRIISPTLT